MADYALFMFIVIFPVIIFAIAAKKQKAAKKRVVAFKESAKNAVEAGRPQNAASASENRKQSARSYTVRDGKPYYSHSVSECTGGSIHDGYHEGSFKPIAPSMEGKAVEGGEGSAILPEAVIHRQSGAEKLSGSVGKLSPAARGVVLAEIIGKPKALR